jgi:hypothetical protein
MPERERRMTLRMIDDLWMGYLAMVADYRSGAQWLSWSGRDPHRTYLLKVHEWFQELEDELEAEIARRMETPGDEFASRGAVWTYLTTDMPVRNASGLKRSVSIRDWVAVYLLGVKRKLG